MQGKDCARADVLGISKMDIRALLTMGPRTAQ
jgi:hypothetical protein